MDWGRVPGHGGDINEAQDPKMEIVAIGTKAEGASVNTRTSAEHGRSPHASTLPTATLKFQPR